MSDLIEEAAKAICCQGGQCMNANSTKFECNSQFFVEEARAVFSRLDALGYAVVPREPTPEMVEAGVAAFTNIHDIYRAMLAAKEGPK